MFILLPFVGLSFKILFTMEPETPLSKPAPIKEVSAENIPHTPMRFMWYVIRPYKWMFFVTILLSTAGAALSSTQPYLLKQIIDSATLASENGFTDSTVVWFWAIVFPFVIIGMQLSHRLSGFIGMRWMTGAHGTTYQVLYSYLSKHSHAYFSNRFAGALANKVSHAADGVESLSESLTWHVYGSFISFIITFIFIATTNLWVGLLFLVLLFFLLPINYFITKYRRKFVVEYAETNTKLKGQTVDVTTNIFAVNQYARRAKELRGIQNLVELRRGTDLRQWRISEWLLVANNAIIVLFISTILFAILWLWTEGIVTIGDFIMVLTLMIQMSGTLTFIGGAMNGFIRNYGHIQEGLDEIMSPHEVVDAPGATQLKVTNGKIRLKSIDFKYNDEDIAARVFDDLSFDIESHQKVGLVGESGAGKTTLVSLLLRQHDLTDGAITIDGQDIAKVIQDSLRENIAVVPQEPMLFHRSIMENIRYGRLDTTDEEVIEAAKMAQAHQFIINTPHQYETLVGERGVKLSGGQRQRIAIARAILKNAPILVLDEATSALDSESEVLIQKALHELMVGKTVIAVAHRLSTLREMDRIIVLDRGKVSQDGSHAELVEQEGIYKRLWSHQAGGFLLDE